ncbi:hypothetical protein Bhyg_04606 [Pseudolycoriella hygida]|uniref:Uncharacterized protein n=1 Tax=Pseudolycoriella hygida TaxID=35572 RepID=A0A9Q0S8L7_9DIPT|nr:hypothetical protein Bhyg_04606 [Pseudolycoriella hygida]
MKVFIYGEERNVTTSNLLCQDFVPPDGSESLAVQTYHIFKAFTKVFYFIPFREIRTVQLLLATSLAMPLGNKTDGTEDNSWPYSAALFCIPNYKSGKDGVHHGEN